MNFRKLSVAAALVASSCSPSIVYTLEIEVEGASGELHAERLHIGTSNSRDVPVPVPWATPTASTDATIKVEGRSLLVTIRVPQEQAELGARFWYDTNGDDIPNEEDREGRLRKRIDGADLGWCDGNDADAGRLRLVEVPSIARSTP